MHASSKSEMPSENSAAQEQRNSRRGEGADSGGKAVAC